MTGLAPKRYDQRSRPYYQSLGIPRCAHCVRPAFPPSVQCNVCDNLDREELGERLLKIVASVVAEDWHMSALLGVELYEDLLTREAMDWAAGHAK